VLAGASFLASQVPEQLFDRLGWDYGLYRIVVFATLALAILLLLLFWLASREETGRADRAAALCGAVLTYLEIFYEQGEDPRHTAPVSPT
jgi:hypothetical protein